MTDTSTSKTTKSIHAAFVELKGIDTRIIDASKEIKNAITAGKGNPTDAQIKEAVALLNRLNDIILRKQVIKLAIQKSNAERTVTIGKEKMTLQTALAMKELYKDYDNAIANITNARGNAQRTVDNENAQLDKKLAQYIATLTGGNAIDEKDLAPISERYLETNKHIVQDPANVAAWGAEIAERKAEFEANVDIALSESNALTYITY